MLLKKALVIDNISIQCVNMVIQDFESKRREKLVPSVFQVPVAQLDRAAAF